MTSGCESVALWRSPNQWRIPIRDYVTNGRELLSILGVAGVVRVMGAMNFIDNRHPEQPHFYLQAIGTDPANQGKGFGAALMRRQLAKTDDLGVPCYLESTRESNILIYAHFGFELVGEIRIPGGPTIHPMWRQPGSGRYSCKWGRTAIGAAQRMLRRATFARSLCGSASRGRISDTQAM